MTDPTDAGSFDPAAREQELRDQAESWDTSTPVPAGPGDIPVIDLGHDPVTVATELRAACETVGFFQLVGHGVDETLVERTFAATRAFHDLDDATKESIAMDRAEWPVRGVGYLRVGERLLPRRAVGNLNEAFLIKQDTGIGFDDNQWPPEPELRGFRATVEAYAAAVEALALRLVPVYAAALELDPDFFADAFADPFWRLRLSHYPGVDTARPTGAYGIAPHVDTTFFTLLRQNGPGLTIYSTPRDAWITVPVIDGAYVVNTGELLRQWSNDRFLSVRHFADNRTSTSRYSIPFFFNANADHVMHPLPTCVSPDAPARYAPVSYRQSQAAVQGE
ncbi:MAG: 2-oxoglutarate and iron-dependent oxygenase domain-containing protein [Acidimicrobiales bacterium]|nr:2-oxoglutarate and iron-dependent oxygenase domain-containing protein [Acidimicrobiales bacterium]